MKKRFLWIGLVCTAVLGNGLADGVLSAANGFTFWGPCAIAVVAYSVFIVLIERWVKTQQ